MFELSCHCGEIRIALPRPPDIIHACNCSLCSKAGADWGYYDPTEVSVTGQGAAYVRPDREDPGAAIHFCRTCGSTTHFTLTPAAVARFGDRVLGVNMRLAEPGALAGVELRFPDGRAWSGQGPFTYVRPPEILGASRPDKPCKGGPSAGSGQSPPDGVD